MPRIMPPVHQKIPEQLRDEIYVDIDDEGYEEHKRPKWTKPATEFQQRLLRAVGRKYYLKRLERTKVILIEKGMLSMADTRIAGTYPTEWVNNCIDWAVNMRRKGNPIQLMSLINLICNTDRRAVFVAEWIRKNGSGVYDQSTVI